jgi:type II secretory pathway component GspD/PulD (secretin)
VVTDTKLTTMSGQKASIDVSQDINVRVTTPINTGGTSSISSQFQTIRAGNVIEIEPVIRADGKVFASLSVESSVPGIAPPDVAPNVDRRKITNKLILEDGQTLEISGLIQQSVKETKQRLPLLGYLPLVGEFFSNTGEDKTNTQLLVYITPYLSRAPQGSVPTLEPASQQPAASNPPVSQQQPAITPQASPPPTPGLATPATPPSSSETQQPVSKPK